MKLAVDLEGDGRQPEGEGAAELLTLAAAVWQHFIRPVHGRQESYHEGQVRATVAMLTASQPSSVGSMSSDDASGPHVQAIDARRARFVDSVGPSYGCRLPAHWWVWAASM